jgi:hypothetical protein
MVSPRHRTPTPAWAELPLADSIDRETFRPFGTTAFLSRIVTRISAAPFGSLPETLSILHDEDGDAPQLDLL